MRKPLAIGLGRLIRDRSGGIMVYTAILAPVIVGAAGLSVDIGLWYANARLTQNAADSAALAGSLEIVRSSGNAAQVEAAVQFDATNQGFSSANGDTITVNYPPTSGPSANSPDAVEVIVSRPAQSLLSQVIFSENPTVAARAVASAGKSDSCVWALNPSAASALKVSGNASLTLDCGILVNSASGSGLTQSGAGCVAASAIRVVGGYSVACSTPQPVAGVTAFDDPLASVAAPSYGNCDFNQNITVNNSQTLNPGTYCGKIRVTASGNLTMNPGLYVFNGAGFDVSGQGTVTGIDVSIYITANSGVPDAITISGGADVTLTAASSGPLPGILVYHDRGSTGNVTHSFTGGSDMELGGILYFPNQAVRFSGGSALDNSAALIIADTVDFTGDSLVALQNDPNVDNPLLTEAQLLE